MSQAEKFVPIVPVSIEQVQQVQKTEIDVIGTSAGTAIGTSSLKALAIKQLQEQKQVQEQVQEQVQALEQNTAVGTKKAICTCVCTYPKVAADEPSAAALAHARRMLVACPVQRRKLHCWYCSRCSEAVRCTAWRPRRQDVEFYRQSEKPHSLDLVESGKVEVLQ